MVIFVMGLVTLDRMSKIGVTKATHILALFAFFLLPFRKCRIFLDRNFVVKSPIEQRHKYW